MCVLKLSLPLLTIAKLTQSNNVWWRDSVISASRDGGLLVTRERECHQGPRRFKEQATLPFWSVWITTRNGFDLEFISRISSITPELKFISIN